MGKKNKTASTSIRSPICSVMGHVDHGKSSILDFIRDTSIVAGEAGAITQAIGASIIPIDTIKKKTGNLLKLGNINIPGLLFIDTPGHAAFSNLRKRGGNLADIAILVVDVNEGFKPQTFEAIEILKSYKTPFVIAANKVDLLRGWKSHENLPLMKNLEMQSPNTLAEFETKVYEIVGKVYDAIGFEADRFDRVDDFTKKIAVIPCSAKTGEGMSELLMLVAGLAQKFLEKALTISTEVPARGTILEVKESQGLGKTIDVIIYEGKLKVGDTLVVAGTDEPLVTRVKALFEPEINSEMRDAKNRFRSVKEVVAAIGVKISAPDFASFDLIAGMPIASCEKKDVDSVIVEMKKEIDEVLIETDEEGVVIKADTLGSLEALEVLLREKGIPIRHAIIGDIARKDILDAYASYEKNPLYSVILGFNVKLKSDINMDEHSDVKVITHDVIYQIIDDYEEWVEKRTKEIEAQKLEGLTKPFKIEFLLNHTFRQSGPAVFGVEVSGGILKTNSVLMKDGSEIGRVRSMELNKESVNSAEKGTRLALSVDGPTIGRTINEGDILYSFISENEFRQFKEHKKLLSEEEKELLKEIAVIMRKKNELWGI